MGLLPELLNRVEYAAPTEVLLATERPLTLIHARGTQSLEGSSATAMSTRRSAIS
ncbi:MAG: hypothetical protein R3B09_33275 [Nannocystaceae bacterium]